MPHVHDKAPPAQYVLCKRATRVTLFACGTDPGLTTFDADGLHARRFDSEAAALAHQAGLPRVDAEACAVLQYLPGGGVVPLDS